MGGGAWDVAAWRGHCRGGVCAAKSPVKKDSGDSTLRLVCVCSLATSKMPAG